MVIHSLEQALNPIREARSHWESRMSEKAVKAAADITTHLNNQNFIMLGLEDDLTEPASESSGFSKKLVRLLSSTWKFNDGTISVKDSVRVEVEVLLGSKC